ncbi:LacI family DNA-binding transcriptional regulator [Plastorhodobacter daqingensis]|uniref:LacI family DNA-binding transcriptional regulator n=1 Tax=Plastorhodobacter daqingensis TaxID=1387281 RepID=A0ABW2UL05_9RHOB
MTPSQGSPRNPTPDRSSDERPRLREVAEAAGVSVITASRCLSNPDRVSEKTRTRVLKVAAELGYIPNRVASGLVSSRTMVIGVVVPTIANPIHSVLLEAFNAQIETQGYRTLLATTSYDAAKEADAVRTLLAYKVDALALAGKVQSADAVRLLSVARVPVVEMFELHDAPVDLNVGLSNFDAGAALARYLLTRGRRAIAYITHSGIDDSRMAARFAGFQETAGAQPDVRLMEFTDSAPPGRLRESAISAILSRFPDVDAIVCSGHQAAVSAIRILTDQGIDIPGRIAVSGFGDSPASCWVRPSLTTVAYPMAEIGAAAGKMLLARLGGEPLPKTQVDLGFEIIERTST